jgi:asparagine synthase (glutamine-hydrolysing)
MAAQERGVRVLLTGLGGDEWFQRPDFHIADLLRRGRVVEAVRWAQSIPATSWWPLRHHPLYAEGISPLIPESMKTRLRRQRSIAETANWIDRSFAGRNNLDDRLRQPLDWQPFGSLARAGGFRAATQGFQVHAMEMEERSAASFHLELRYPFHDRRIIEFGMGLPAEQRWKDGLHKYLLREAMQHHLPEKVRQRRSKAEFSRVFVEALLVLGRDAFTALGIAEAGWVDGTVVLEMYDRMERRFRGEDICQGSELWPLWSVFGTELLYSQVFNSPGSNE